LSNRPTRRGSKQPVPTTRQPATRTGQATSKPATKDWKHELAFGLFRLLDSVPVRARVNLVADLILVLILLIGGKYLQPLPVAVNAVGFLFPLFFVGGCLFYTYLRSK